MSDPSQILRATYNSPKNLAFSHTTSIPLLPSDIASTRIDYVSTLRIEAAKLQGLINAELTDRMENDKAQQASASTGSVKKDAVDEIAEEENYGEEAPEED